MRTIAIDLDNVISDTDAKIRQIIRKKCGLNARRKDIIEFDYENCLPITKEQSHEVLREFHNYHLLTLRTIPNARSALQIVTRRFKVIIATDRPQETKQATTKWLHLRNIPSSDIIFVKDKVQLLNANVNWLVEDRWETAIKVADAGVHVILFDKPWNRKGSHRLIHRAHGWKQVLGILRI